MDKDELFKLNSEITDLEIKLSKLKSKRKQLKDNIDYLVGCHLTRSKFYYKVLSINKEEQTVEALCVTYEEDEEYSISLLPALSFEYVNGLALMSSKVFEKLYKEVMEKYLNNYVSIFNLYIRKYYCFLFIFTCTLLL